MEETRELHDTMMCAVRSAGAILEEGFGDRVLSQKKRDGSLVTDFDKKAEEKIIEIIKSRFPNHSILAEESGGEIGDGYTWLIDPLDGTSNFVMHNPIFGVSVAVLLRREPQAACVLFPVLEELYSAVKDREAYLNDKVTMVSRTAEVRNAVVVFAKGRSEEAFRRLIDLFSRVGDKVRTFRISGCVTFDACQVAAGRVDGFFNIATSPWDAIGPSFIVERAGGKVSNLRGGRVDPGDKTIMATNGNIHEEMLRIVARTST